jgi:hypothetical protein
LEDFEPSKEDIDNWILSKLGAYKICSIEVDNQDQSRKEDLELRNRREIL